MDTVAGTTDIQVGLSPYFRPIFLLEDRDDHGIFQ